MSSSPPPPPAGQGLAPRPSMAPLTGDLSPSRLSTMPAVIDLSTLPPLLEQTRSSLDQIWSQVGYSDVEKGAQLSALMDSIRNLCEKKVQEEEAVMEQFKHAIDETRKEIIETSNALHRPVPDGVLSASEGTLTESLESLTDVAESLRSTAQGARMRIKVRRGAARGG